MEVRLIMVAYDKSNFFLKKVLGVLKQGPFVNVLFYFIDIFCTFITYTFISLVYYSTAMLLL